jgi:hypothetical protein
MISHAAIGAPVISGGAVLSRILLALRNARMNGSASVHVTTRSEPARMLTN